VTSGRDILAMVFAWPLWALLAWLLPQIWRNVRGLHTDTPPQGLRAGPAWHAFVRVQPVGSMVFLAIIPPVFVLELVAEGSTVGVICRVLIGLAGLAAFTLVPAVWFYNRPSFLVAPHHRSLPGFLAERRGEPPPPVPPSAKPPKWHASTTP
jgi:hypothetical protein